jgi:hypothetical protein
MRLGGGNADLPGTRSAGQRIGQIGDELVTRECSSLLCRVIDVLPRAPCTLVSSVRSALDGNR